MGEREIKMKEETEAADYIKVGGWMVSVNIDICILKLIIAVRDSRAVEEVLTNFVKG